MLTRAYRAPARAMLVITRSIYGLPCRHPLLTSDPFKAIGTKTTTFLGTCTRSKILATSASTATIRFQSTSSQLLNASASVKRRRRKPAFLDPSPITPSAEEAVNNIIYNTPPTAPAPITRHVLNCLVSNEPGVLSHVSGVLAGRGFNIESLVVAKTEVPDLSRMTIVLNGQKVVIEQARRQLEDLVPIWAVLDYTHGRIVERELLLAKVSAVPHEHVHEFERYEVEGHEVEHAEV